MTSRLTRTESHLREGVEDVECRALGRAVEM